VTDTLPKWRVTLLCQGLCVTIFRIFGPAIKRVFYVRNKYYVPMICEIRVSLSNVKRFIHIKLHFEYFIVTYFQKRNRSFFRLWVLYPRTGNLHFWVTDRRIYYYYHRVLNSQLSRDTSATKHRGRQNEDFLISCTQKVSHTHTYNSRIYSYQHLLQIANYIYTTI